MSHSPAFQFYANDWLSSTKIMLMTPAQEGAYIRLLCIAWNDPDCSIPDDDDELALLSRLGEGWFNGGSTKIRNCFEPHPKLPGRLVNTRLLEERKKQEEWRAKSRAGGVKSGKSRRNKPDSAPKGGSRVVPEWLEPNANQTGTLQSSSSYSSSISNEIEEEVKSPSSSRSRRPTNCDESFLAELQANPAYQTLDVKRLYAKMCVWCQQKGKQPTRLRFINWLNREEQPMALMNGAPSGAVNGSGRDRRFVQ